MSSINQDLADTTLSHQDVADFDQDLAEEAAQQYGNPTCEICRGEFWTIYIDLSGRPHRVACSCWADTVPEGWRYWS